MLANRVALTIKPVTQFLIARTLDGEITGGNIVYKQVKEYYGGIVPILNAS